MGQFLLFLIVLAVSGWATVLVMNHGPSITRHRVYLYIVIWLLPFFGAAFAGYVVHRLVRANSDSDDDRLFQAVVRKRSEISNS